MKNRPARGRAVILAAMAIGALALPCLVSGDTAPAVSLAAPGAALPSPDTGASSDPAPMPPSDPAPSPSYPAGLPLGARVSVLVGGTSVEWAVSPHLSDDTVVIALRCLARNLGFPIRWDEAGRQALVERGDGETIAFPDGSRLYLVAGVGHYAGVITRADTGRTMVDLRFAAKALNIHLDWNPGTLTADLNPNLPYVDLLPPPDPNRVAYLTFDDGPVKGVTTRILDILAEYQAPATFFVVGRLALGHPDLLRRMVSEDHAIGNHTMTHAHRRSEPGWIYASTEAFIAEIDACSQVILEATGVQPRVFRAPGGSGPYLTRAMLDALAERGMVNYDWNASTGDSAWPRPTPDQMLESVIRRSYGGSRTPLIILMHDGPSRHEPTAEAVPAIIEYLRYSGYTLQLLEPQPPAGAG